MEYLAGGNLLSLMYKYDTFDEDTARFYIAETILGVQEIHNFNYVYRYLIFSSIFYILFSSLFFY
jgi:serine/threonine protein kinase